MWNYVVTANKPTAVSHSVTGNFTSPTDLNLIISKSTRLEIHVYAGEEEGLQPVLDTPVYGRITALELFRPPGETQDLLFLLTEKYHYCVLGFDAKTGELVTRAKRDVRDRIGRAADIGQLAIIDPECRAIGLHLYDGLFKVIPIEKDSKFKEPLNLRLEELQVVDIKFLHGCSKPTIAILFQDSKEKRHVKTYEINVRDKELREGWMKPNVEEGASLLIPIPKPHGGCLIVGEKSIVYHSSGFTKAWSMKPAVIRAYTKLDAAGLRYLVSDDLGMLGHIVLQAEGNKIVDLKLEQLGQTNFASSISYLDSGVVFIGSLYGDSQLIKLLSQKDETTNSYIELLDTYTNLGPITDFCVVDLDRQGQGQVVTCSGAFRDGSLRIIRNGIGINEQATIELAGIKGVWSMKPSSDAEFDKFLVVSFIAETRVLSIAGEELEETEIPGFRSDTQTLYCGNAVSNQFVQATAHSVRLVDANTLTTSHEWNPPAGVKINNASCNQSQILISTGGGKVVYLQVQGNKLVEIGHTTMEHEVSCLNVTPLAGESISNVCVVGLWTDISLRILSLPDLKELNKTVLGGEVIPRSVLFASLEGIQYLLCGLGDGHLFSFVYDPVSNELNDRKKVSLGTQPILLVPFRSKDANNIFAASDRPTVIYSSKKKLSYSNVNLKEVNYMCPFNTENFPDSLTIASESALTVGTVDEIQKLHIQTIPLGEMPRRICYLESCRAFGLLTEKTTINEDGEPVDTNTVRLLNDQTFEIISSYPLNVCENLCSIISCQFAEDPEHYLVVGTAYAYSYEPEPTRGRILVFQVRDQKLVLVAEKDVTGATFSLNAFNGKLLASINNKIQLFKWVEVEEGKQLRAECSHQEHVMALFSVTRGDFIVVGDLMRSISLLAYDPVNTKITEIARDYNPNWMTSIEVLDDDSFIGAENSFNLFTVRRNSDAATDEERGRLEAVGEYHLGEFVNRFRKGSLVMKNQDPDASGPLSTLLFGTVSGAVGVVASLNQQQYDFFLKLQQAMNSVINTVGGLSHDEFRAFQTERKTTNSRNFIDGDLIESFLDLKRDKMEEIVKSMGPSHSIEDVTKRIETLAQALH